MNNVSEIAKLNDEFRANPSLGTLILTEGIRSNSSEDIVSIINKVRNFNNFDEDNNPYGERDFGAFDFKGKKIFWKIDYYDNKFLFLSPNACKPKLTNRVMTIMYADEYQEMPMRYDVICSTSIDELIKWVNEQIKKGWELQGGIATMTQQIDYTVFYQAMVKKQPNPYKW